MFPLILDELLSVRDLRKLLERNREMFTLKYSIKPIFGVAVVSFIIVMNMFFLSTGALRGYVI